MSPPITPGETLDFGGRVRQFEDVIALATAQGVGKEMMALATRLFPICRSITGPGIRETLDILGEMAPLERHQVPTGYEAFDWKVPQEWRIRDAFIKDESGVRIIDFKESNLHVVSYSVPVNTRLTLDELRPHLYSDPTDPEAIPYRTSYYSPNWGFCLSQAQLDSIPDGTYEVVIDSTLEDGHLDYADSLVGSGSSGREVLLTTYSCHPSMGNNELSGPILSVFLNQFLRGLSLRHTYRFVYAPETIGALVYLSRNGEHLRRHLDAGYVLTCVGDDGPYTYKRSRRGNTVGDRAAEHALSELASDDRVSVLDFFPSGSDERQYCSPGFDLPVGSLMRSMYGTYPEYHTSLDDLDFISAKGLADSLAVYLRVIQVLEMNDRYINTNPYGEPQLGRRGLYPQVGAAGVPEASMQRIAYLLAYGDGDHDLIDIAARAGQPVWDFGPELQQLLDAGLLTTETGHRATNETETDSGE